MNNIDDVNESGFNSQVSTRFPYVVSPVPSQNPRGSINVNNYAAVVKFPKQAQGCIATSETVKDLS